MFESDPLNEIVGDDPMRDQLIDALVENAYAAAQVEIDRESAQRGGIILGAFERRLVSTGTAVWTSVSSLGLAP